ncbi:MAG: sigma-70 family RNA polymerase sigma factor [Acidobacteriota bacterium]|nr:sigma-70 family RNA polymerase sigma factor [Acidobacteriota bacterium]
MDTPASGRQLEILLDNHRKFLSFLQARVGERAIAEDIIQDAFVRNLSKIEDLPDAAVVPWFYATLRNAVIDRHRRQVVEHTRLDAFAHELERRETASEEMEREICACVGRLAETLKPEYADALARIDVEGRAVKDYAASLGLTAGNASVRVHRARQALRKRVMESCGMCAEHGCVDCSCAGRR